MKVIIAIFEVVRWIYLFPDRMEAIFRKYPKDSTIPVFCKELRKVGFCYFRHAKDYEWFCQNNPKKTRNIILEYYDKSVLELDKGLYISCLFNKEHLDLFDFVFQEFINYSNLCLDEMHLCQKIAEIIYHTKNIKNKDVYIKYLYNHENIAMFKYLFIDICGYYKFEETHDRIVNFFKYYSSLKTYESARNALKNYSYKEDEKLLKKHYSKSDYKKDAYYIEQLKLKDQKVRDGIYSKDSTIPIFKKTLKKKFNLDDNTDILDFCHTNAKKVRDIVIDFYKKALLKDDQRYYLECLDSSENYDLISFFINEMELCMNKWRDYHYIVVTGGSYFSYVHDKKFKDRYIKIFLDETLPHEVRVYILYAIVSLRLPGIESYIVDSLQNDNSIWEYTGLKYLSTSKEIEKYKKIFEKYKNNHDAEVRNVAKKALKKIEMKLEKRVEKQKIHQNK